jgi:hypothetical protein
VALSLLQKTLLYRGVHQKSLLVGSGDRVVTGGAIPCFWNSQSTGIKNLRGAGRFKSSQVNTLPKAKKKNRSKQNKDMHKFSSVYSERGVPLPVLTSGGE